MGQKSAKRGLRNPIMIFALAAVLAAFLIYVPGQAASPAAGLESHQKAGLTCQNCHKESPPKELVPGAQCLTCHGDLAKLVAKSSKAVPNPHASPHLNPGEVPKCEDCHHIHKPSVVSCKVCHQDFQFNMP